MKTFTHLWLDDKGLKAFNAIENKTDFNNEQYVYSLIEHQEALQQALAEGVYFKDDWKYHNILRIATTWEKHKPYPVPDGYEVQVFNRRTLDEDDYAVLVPKEKCREYCNCAKEAMNKGANRDWVEETQDSCPLKPTQVVNQWEDTEQNRALFDKITKQQSIEEAASRYAGDYRYNINNGLKWEAAKNGFIAGAKSEAAKQYWYEQFMKMDDIRMFLLSHPDQEMIRASCLHFLGDKFQEFDQKFKREQQ